MHFGNLIKACLDIQTEGFLIIWLLEKFFWKFFMNVRNLLSLRCEPDQNFVLLREQGQSETECQLKWNPLCTEAIKAICSNGIQQHLGIGNIGDWHWHNLLWNRKFQKLLTFEHDEESLYFPQNISMFWKALVIDSNCSEGEHSQTIQRRA